MPRDAPGTPCRPKLAAGRACRRSWAFAFPCPANPASLPAGADHHRGLPCVAPCARASLQGRVHRRSGFAAAASACYEHEMAFETCPPDPRLEATIVSYWRLDGLVAGRLYAAAPKRHVE